MCVRREAAANFHFIEDPQPCCPVAGFPCRRDIPPAPMDESEARFGAVAGPCYDPMSGCAAAILENEQTSAASLGSAVLNPRDSFAAVDQLLPFFRLNIRPRMNVVRGM